MFAGNGIAGFSGDGGAAANASISTPRGLAFDALGNLLITDPKNNRVGRVDLAWYRFEFAYLRLVFDRIDTHDIQPRHWRAIR
jgi:hypothetical protein